MGTGLVGFLKADLVPQEAALLLGSLVGKATLGWELRLGLIILEELGVAGKLR